eukprot:m.127339 g.127339  ORF g.127339 m.127339 type:complete len:253 (+) comp9720_c2_seq1:119-877(+)
MAIWFDRRDVRKQLMDLGYEEVPEDVLDDFVQDLERMAIRDYELDSELNADARSVASSVATSVRSTASTSSRKRKTVRKGGPVQVSEPAAPAAAASQVPFDLDLLDQLDNMLEEQSLPDLDGFEDWEVEHEHAHSVAASEPPSVGGECCPERPKSVIWSRQLREAEQDRPKRKTDPVARGRRYRSGWQAQRAPGESNHQALRWKVREQLIRDQAPPFERPRRQLKPNNYVVPTEKKRQNLRWAVREHLVHMR